MQTLNSRFDLIDGNSNGKCNHANAPNSCLSSVLLPSWIALKQKPSSYRAMQNSSFVTSCVLNLSLVMRTIHDTDYFRLILATRCSGESNQVLSVLYRSANVHSHWLITLISSCYAKPSPIGVIQMLFVRTCTIIKVRGTDNESIQYFLLFPQKMFYHYTVLVLSKLKK